MTYDKLKATDKMAVNRGENSYQVPIADAFSGDKLKDDDQFLVNRGGNSYRISRIDLSAEVGPLWDKTIATPTWLSPVDGAGITTQAISDEIIAVTESDTVLKFHGDKDITLFEVGDEIAQDSGYDAETDPVISINEGLLFLGGDKDLDVIRDGDGSGPGAKYSEQPEIGSAYAANYSWPQAYINPPNNTLGVVAAGYGQYTKDLSATPVTVPKGATLKIWCSGAAGGMDSFDELFSLNGQRLNTLNTWTMSDMGWNPQSNGPSFAEYSVWPDGFTITSTTVSGDIRWQYMDIDGKKVIDTDGYQIDWINPSAKIVATIPKDYFLVGETIALSFTAATGTIESINADDNAITLTSAPTSPERWIANRGKFVKGLEKPSKNAAVDIDITFQSSAFVSTPEGNLKHVSSDWQIFAKSDIDYNTPLQESLDDTTNLTSWKPPVDLDKETSYRARVRYKANTGTLSDWGECVFRTLEPWKPNNKFWGVPAVAGGGLDQSGVNEDTCRDAFDGQIVSRNLGCCAGWIDLPTIQVPGPIEQVEIIVYYGDSGGSLSTVYVQFNPGGKKFIMNTWTVLDGSGTTTRCRVNIDVDTQQKGITAFRYYSPGNKWFTGMSVELQDGQGMRPLVNPDIRSADFFDENTGRPNTKINLMSKYGVDPENDYSGAARLGIWPIFKQETGYAASHYVKELYGYRAIAYPYSIAEQQTMDLIREAKVAAEDLEDWLDKKKR